MKGKTTYHRNGSESYSIDGQDCTKEEFEAAFPPKDLSGAPGAGSLAGYPIYSESLAIPPWQINEAMARDKRLGAPVTEYDKETGAPKLESPGHRAQYMRAHDFHDRNSFTGH